MNEAKYQLNLFSRQKTQSFILRFDDEREVIAFTGLKVLNPEIIIAELSRIEENIIERAANREKSNGEHQIVMHSPIPPVTNTPIIPDFLTPPCHYCGGPCWDNRENKKTSKHPDWKCKDCGAAGWIDKKTGKVSWRESRV